MKGAVRRSRILAQSSFENLVRATSSKTALYLFTKFKRASKFMGSVQLSQISHPSWRFEKHFLSDKGGSGGAGGAADKQFYLVFKTARSASGEFRHRPRQMGARLLPSSCGKVALLQFFSRLLRGGGAKRADACSGGAAKDGWRKYHRRD